MRMYLLSVSFLLNVLFLILASFSLFCFRTRQIMADATDQSIPMAVNSTTVEKKNLKSFKIQKKLHMKK